MKSTLVLILILSLYSVQVYSAGVSCNVQEFKKQYIDLQNALRYEGNKIEYKNGSIRATSEKTDKENSPGRKAEIALYKNYKAALGKVKKIYDHINAPDKASAEEKALLSNPEVTNFFKAIDPTTSSNSSLDVNLDKLLKNFQDNVKGKDFSLNDNDVYLLKKLVVHSQDRICTLENYVNPKKAGNQLRTQYLEDLKSKPLNKMIESLRKMVGTEDLKFSNEDLAIDKAVEEGINKLHQMARNCSGKMLDLKSLKFNEKIQDCNYGKFLKSISADDNSFRSFEAILHFINANQVVKNARTSLNWLDEQFVKDTFTSCHIDPETKALYVKNLPFKNDTIDASKIKCTKGERGIGGSECLKGLSFEFENGRGHKITASRNSGIKTFTISDTSNCSNMALQSPPAAVVETEEQKCKKDEKKEWKNGKCEDKKGEALVPQTPKVCNKEQCSKLEIGKITEWHDEGKFCYAGNKGVSLDVAKQSAICNEDGSIELPETKNSCQAKKMEFNEQTKKCEETLASCKDKKQDFDADKKICVETAESCGEKKLGFDTNTKACTDTAESCKNKDKDFDKEKNACKDKPTAQDEIAAKKADCDKKIEKDKDEETGRQLNNWTWNDKTNQCDKRAEKSESKDHDQVPDEKKEPVYPNKPVPGRFQPMTIPSRQIFILPGMP